MPTATIEELLTSPGTAVGTVSFMSPEQVRGEELDTRTDVFSFGAELYEMTTGQRALSRTTAGVIHDAILNRSPVAPTSLDPKTPPKLEEIIRKPLEKDRDIRCQSAAELRADLNRLKRDTESGIAAGIAASPEKPLKRRKLLVVVSACITIVGLAAVAIWYARSGRTATQFDSLAVLPFTNGGGDANTDCLSDGITESLIGNLAHLPQPELSSNQEAPAKIGLRSLRFAIVSLRASF